MSTSPTAPIPVPTLLKRGWRVCQRVAIGFAICIGCYCLLVLIGLIPVNNDFEPTPAGVRVYIISNPIHSDIVLPMKHEVINWREQFPEECFTGKTSRASHVAVGWGDQGFYINTPTWSDFRCSTALNAMFWPSKSCMHITCTSVNALPADAKAVTISAAQYARLVEFIVSSFRRDETGAVLQIEQAAYSGRDAFFAANGSYHCLNTCHNWLGRGLQAAGVRVGWFTPLPKTILWYLPDEQTADPPNEEHQWCCLPSIAVPVGNGAEFLTVLITH